VWFENRHGAPLNQEALAKAILAQENLGTVDTIEIEWNSLMESPWVAALFPNLRNVDLSGRRLETLEGLREVAHLETLSIDIHKSKRRSLELLPELSIHSLGVRAARADDATYLGRCRPLQYFGLTSWPLPDLSAVSRLEAAKWRISLGRLTSLHGMNCARLDEVWFMQCTKLESVAGARIRYMVAAACNRLAMETLGDVEGLTTLWLMDQKSFDSFGFLRRCQSLESLTVDSTRITATDWDSVSQHPTLGHLWLGWGVPDAAVRCMATENPRLAVANGSLYFFRGHEVSQDDWFLLVRERTKPAGEANEVGGLVESE
jgi:hypothetical protein